MTKLGGAHGARRDSATAQAGGRMKQSSAKNGRVAGPPVSFSPLPPQPMSEPGKWDNVPPVYLSGPGGPKGYGIAYERPFVYGKLLCPNGHGQLVLGQMLLAKRYCWCCLQCDTIKPCKHQGGTRQHAKTTRRKQ